MRANVPQFIEIEDKIAGPLTWKQLFWMIGLLVILLVLYNLFSAGAFILIGIPVSLIFIAFAFIKPYGQTMTSFVYYGAMHLFGPKIYVWKREVHLIQTQGKQDVVQETYEKNKKNSPITSQDIQNLAETLDKKIPF